MTTDNALSVATVDALRKQAQLVRALRRAYEVARQNQDDLFRSMQRFSDFSDLANQQYRDAAAQCIACENDCQPAEETLLDMVLAAMMPSD